MCGHIRQYSIWAGLAPVPGQSDLEAFYPFTLLVGSVPLSCCTEAKSLSRVVRSLGRTKRPFNLLANLASHHPPTFTRERSFDVDSDPAAGDMTDPERYGLFGLLTNGGVLLFHGTLDLGFLGRSTRLSDAR